MKTLLHRFASRLANLLATLRPDRAMPGREERYLARAVDAHDLQVRLLAIERERP